MALLSLDEAILKNFGMMLPIALTKSLQVFPIQLGTNIRRHRLHVAGWTGTPSQTRLLDISDLPRLSACTFSLMSAKWDRRNE
jgi:hypothetical protein